MNPVPTVRQAMSSDPFVARPDMQVHEAMDVLIDGAVSGLPVVDVHQTLVGMITERDCLEVVFEAGYHARPGRTVAEVMSTDVETIEADSDVVAAIERFRTSRYRRFPVLDGTRMIGVLSRRDVLRALRDVV